MFGCATYAHRSAEKLEPKSPKCFFLGYRRDVKGYKLWIRDGQVFRVIISMDVIFDEESMSCWVDNKVGADVSINSESRELDLFF